MEKMTDSGYKLPLQRFQLDTGGKFPTMKRVRHQDNLLMEVFGLQ